MAKVKPNLMDEAKRADKRRNLYMFGGIGLVLAIMFGAIIWEIQANKVDLATELVAPAGATKDFGIVVKADEKTAGDKVADIVVYEDFSCPHCKEFEAASAGTLDLLGTTGKANVEYRVVAFMTPWSMRAANASMCALETGGTDNWMKAHLALYEGQPIDGSDPGDSDALRLLRDADVEFDEACVKSQKYKPWLRKATAKFEDDEINGTPAVYVNDEVVDAGPLQITKAVNEVLAGE